MGYTGRMPWKETCVRDERTIMIGEYLSGDYSISQVAKRRGISRKTAYKWIERYEQDRDDGLKNRSRAPRHHPNAVSQQMESRILQWKEQRPLWGAPKIHAKLREYADCPAESTVSNILKRHGLTRQVRRRRGATPSGALIQVDGPNEVWCADFKGWFYTGDGQRCDPLTISDGYSRYLLCCQGIAGFTGTRTVKALFELTFRANGLPQRIRTDNGTPFASVGLCGLSLLSVWWLRLGIELERIEPGQPQQNGRHERLHRTLREAVINPAQWNLARQQKAFERFTRDYNYERPHEALNQNPPASVYEPSRRDYPERLAEIEYPDGWEKRRISLGGQMRWKSCRVHVSHALVGQVVGLEPISDGIWKLHFAGLELGQFDERQRQVKGNRALTKSQAHE
jgi:putative transposase